MPTQPAHAPFYISENRIVTLWNDGKRRTMRVAVESDVHIIDITSLPKDTIRNLADDIEVLAVWIAEKTRDVERSRHAKELLRICTYED